MNANYTIINQEAANKDPASVLNHFRKVVDLRKKNAVLVHGKYELLDKDNTDVYAYTRTGDGDKMLVLLNFTTHEATTTTGIDLKNATMLLSNYDSAPTLNQTTVKLRPYEAVIYRVK